MLKTCACFEVVKLPDEALYITALKTENFNVKVMRNTDGAVALEPKNPGIYQDNRGRFFSQNAVSLENFRNGIIVGAMYGKRKVITSGV
jgi:hypothetical protein